MFVQTRTLRRNIFQRLFGMCATKLPSNPDCWKSGDGEIVILLKRAPELSEPWGAIRLEGRELPDRLLVFRDEDGQFHALRNRCGHGGRRLDPVPGTETIQCCSIGKTTYGYSGEILSGPAKEQVQTFPAEVRNGNLHIAL